MRRVGNGFPRADAVPTRHDQGAVLFRWFPVPRLTGDRYTPPDEKIFPWKDIAFSGGKDYISPKKYHKTGGYQLPLWIEIVFYFFVFLLLLGLSAFFSGSETAFFSLSRSTLEEFRVSRKKSLQRVAELMKHPRQLLITIVLGNTIVNITTASLAAVLTHRLGIALALNPRLVLFADIVVVTMVLLIFSEILPKVVAVRKPQTYARHSSLPLTILFYFLFPISFVLARFTEFIQNWVGFSPEKAILSEGEVKTLVAMGQEQGALEKDEKEMIFSIFEFGETSVKEIMVPRTDMVCIELNTTLTQLMELIKSKMLSRIPVYKERIDNIVGILYVKDLLPLLSKRRRERLNLGRLVRQAYFVPEQKKIAELLREFQKERIHMAIVVDEYGGVSGLVTLEDIIEEIVGEIQDEFDREPPLYKKVDENTYIVDGRMPLEEINHELHLNLPTEEGVETISGFILSLLGSLPKEKESTYYNGYQFIVERVVKNRILKVRIERTQPRPNDKIENEVRH
ncbi:MAG: HlyC/CorC family transporter [Calditrichaeota bacterium]|nr:MAG: HlyC/CorC family transporter [Calditrichota bacterium]